MYPEAKHVIAVAVALTFTRQIESQKAATNNHALIEITARAIAEYRLPLPGAVKERDIRDGLWFNSLPENKKTEMFGEKECFTPYGWIICGSLKHRLGELYTDKANLRIPYDEALYIVMQQEKGAPQTDVKLEIMGARLTMQEYYALLDKPSPYVTYDSLSALRDDIDYNALKRDRIVKRLDMPDLVSITIKGAKVYSVTKNPKWPGVIVMTYEKAGGELLFGVVYVSSDDLKDEKTFDFIENLKKDDAVRIIGSAYAVESRRGDRTPSEAIRISACVYRVAPAR